MSSASNVEMMMYVTDQLRKNKEKRQLLRGNVIKAKACLRLSVSVGDVSSIDDAKDNWEELERQIRENNILIRHRKGMKRYLKKTTYGKHFRNVIHKAEKLMFTEMFESRQKKRASRRG